MKKINASFIVFLLFASTILFAIPVNAADSITINYSDLELNTPYEDWNGTDVWDLTQGDLTLSYTIDMSTINQPGTWYTFIAAWTTYVEVGLRGEGAGNFNPGPFGVYQGRCGGWMTSDSDTWADSDGYTESGNPDPDSTQDLDDKHALSASGGRGEGDYDVLGDDWDTVLAPFGSGNNFGIWFDRDGVDQWQDDMWGNLGPGGVGSGDGLRYNTGGIYDIVITYHAIDANGNGDKTDDGLGVMFATVNGYPTGFYTTWVNGEPQLYPAGLSFKGDMEHMQVFAGIWAPDYLKPAQIPADHDFGYATLTDITVEGYAGTSDPLVADFTYTFTSDVLSPGDTVTFTDATHGGMPPYTYAWNFGDGTTSTEQNPTHVYAAAGSYDVTLTVTPFRCVPKTVTKTLCVVETGYLTVIKYYDANANGEKDPDEQQIIGWKVTIDGTEYTTPATVELPLGEYTVEEVMPNEDYWINTTSTSVDVTVTEEPSSLLQMYATAYTTGDAVSVVLDPYNPPNHALRFNPANALGPFDAVQDPATLNQRFFALNARTMTDYTFESDFWNVMGVPDIEFAEITWGSWHTEAALVYLTEAYVRDAGDNVVPYGATDDGIGYYAGIVWNKIGILGLTDAEREAKAQEYATAMGVTRSFLANEFEQDGNFGISQFHLPDEVVCATGVTLIDITEDVYDMVNGYIGPYAYPSGSLSGLPGTYTNVAGTGAEITVTSLDPYEYTATSGYDGNTDGFDLDAIRVYRPDVEFGDLCLGAGGGHTPGYWQNKNGKATFTEVIGEADAIDLLVNLNLRNEDGSDFDPSNYNYFKAWLRSSRAVNMAYKLSVSLAAMELNVEAEFVDSDALIYAPGVIDGTDFITIAELMDAANDALGEDGLTLPGNENRDYQEILYKALDDANNNLNFVQAEPCPFTYPT